MTQGFDCQQSREPWGEARVNEELKQIMANIHATCVEESPSSSGAPNYQDRANRAAFKRVADR